MKPTRLAVACIAIPLVVLLGSLSAIETAGVAQAEEKLPPIVIGFEPSPQVDFAAKEIRSALAGRDVSFVSLAKTDGGDRFYTIVLAAGDEPCRATAGRFDVAAGKHNAAQSYAIRVTTFKQRPAYIVLGADPVGAMYGGLDIAEAVRLGTLKDLKDGDHTPYIARRGIKFNIPLDARTPSYSDSGDAAQQNIPEMWSREFWHRMLDEMARHRFNALTLWNLHPFPSLVKVPEYPDVALDDVRRTTLKFDTTFKLTGRDMVRPEMLENLETVKRMTIGEKIAFWREVMQHAHDRGIEVYIFTWNIFVWGAEGKYGITAAQDNLTTIDYFRRSVRETVLTYPLLAGIGVTAGENMQDRKDHLSKEQWLWKTYGEGIRDAKQRQPGRSVRLIHRYHQTNLDGILSAWKDYPDTFDLSFKYAIAHMYSVPAPPFAKKSLAELPSNLRMWMTVRNDDIYSFRWGDPTFARAFIRALPGPDQLAGYYMGPDGYIWGREFLSTEPETPRQTVIEKQWLSFMLWGRLSYDPTLPDALFSKALAARCPGVPADPLFEASCRASQIIPLVTRFYWNDIDLKWFPEACISHPSFKGFHTVKHFVEGKAMPESRIVDIRSYVDAVLNSRPIDGQTPPQVAAELRDHAKAVFELIEPFGRPESKELRLTLGDYAAMAHLGNYYAEKIAGATELGFFDRTGQAMRQKQAVEHLARALEHWKRYAAAATRQYKPQHLTRIGLVDLDALTAKVEEDIAIARDWKPQK